MFRVQEAILAPKEKTDMKSGDSAVIRPGALIKEFKVYGACSEVKRNPETGSWYFDFTPNRDINPDSVTYPIIVAASRFRRKAVSELNDETDETSVKFRPREQSDVWAGRKEAAVGLLTRGNPLVIPPEERKTIDNYMRQYVTEGTPMGIEREFFDHDLAALHPDTKHLTPDRAYTIHKGGLSEIFKYMREYSEGAVQTIDQLEEQEMRRMKKLYAAARKKNFIIDWSGFMQRKTTPGVDPDRTFVHALDAKKVPGDIAKNFPYLEAVAGMFSELMIEFIGDLMSRSESPFQKVQAALRALADNFGFTGPRAVHDMVKKYGWQMWQPLAFHFSISLPQDHNGLVPAAAARGIANLDVSYAGITSVLNYSTNMAHGVEFEGENSRGEIVPLLSTREPLRVLLPTSMPAQHTPPHVGQLEQAIEIYWNGGGNQLDRCANPVVVAINGKRVVYGPVHSSHRLRITTGVDSLLECMRERERVVEAGGSENDVRKVRLKTLARAEDTSAEATSNFRANKFRICLQHMRHIAAMLAARDGVPDVFKWLADRGVIAQGKAEEIYRTSTDDGFRDQMAAITGELDTEKLDEMSKLVRVLKTEIKERYGVEVDRTPHLQQIFDGAKQGIETLRNVHSEMFAERGEFLGHIEKVREAYHKRGDAAAAGKYFYHWYCRNPRIAAYASYLKDEEIVYILLNVMKIEAAEDVCIPLPSGEVVRFNLADTIRTLCVEGEKNATKRGENRALLLEFLFDRDVERMYTRRNSYREEATRLAA